MKRKILAWTFVSTLVLGGLIVYATNTPSEENIFQLIKSFSQAMNLVEKEYVHKIDPLDLVRWAIRGMVIKLDPHSSYLTEKELKELRIRSKGEYGGLGFTVGMRGTQIIIIAPFEGTPAHRAGLQPGDKIISINDISTRGMALDEAVDKMRGVPGTRVTLAVIKEGIEQEIPITLTREIIHLNNIMFYGIIPETKDSQEKIGYIRLTGFAEGTSDELTNALDSLLAKQCKKFIIDLRRNSGGLLDEAIKVSDILLPQSSIIVSTKGKNPNTDRDYYSIKQPKIQNMPLIMLVDGASASAAEIVAGAIQDWDIGLILGDTTYGKGSVQAIRPLAAGALKLTTARYHTPSGKCIDRCDTTQFLIRNPTLDSTFFSKGHLKRKFVSHGAITPDITLPPLPLMHPLTIKLLVDTLGGGFILDKFASKFIKNNPHIKEDLEINKQIISEFEQFIREKGFDFTTMELDSSVNDIKNILKQKIFQLKWGIKGEYTAMLQTDPWIKETTKLLSQSNSVNELFEAGGIK